MNPVLAMHGRRHGQPELRACSFEGGGGVGGGRELGIDEQTLRRLQHVRARLRPGRLKYQARAGGRVPDRSVGHKMR